MVVCNYAEQQSCKQKYLNPRKALKPRKNHQYLKARFFEINYPAFADSLSIFLLHQAARLGSHDASARGIAVQKATKLSY